MKHTRDVGFTGYLQSLRNSWEALSAPHAGARVIRGGGFFAARFPRHPVLDNAVLLDPAALPRVRAVYAGLAGYAVWSAHVAAAAALAEAGMEPDVTTVPMRCSLSDAPAPVDAPVVVADADPAIVAALNGVDPDLLTGVPGLRAFATSDGESGLVVIHRGADVNVSFVATRPEHRRRGLAGAVLRFALASARSTGSRTASLQATPMAEGLYVRSGFVPVGAWQEWVPAGTGHRRLPELSRRP